MERKIFQVTDTLCAGPVEGNPNRLSIAIVGLGSTLWWTNPKLVQVESSEENTLEFDLVATPPVHPCAPQTICPVIAWTDIDTDGNYENKFIKVNAQTNSVKKSLKDIFEEKDSKIRYIAQKLFEKDPNMFENSEQYWFEAEKVLAKSHKSKSKNLVSDCAYHFGEKLGTFQNASFVGYAVCLPMKVACKDTEAESYNLYFTTKESAANLCGSNFLVYINNNLVDQCCCINLDEFTMFTNLCICADKLNQYTEGKDHFVLKIEYKPADMKCCKFSDFMITRIESQGLLLELGY